MKRKGELIKKTNMPIESIGKVLDNIQSEERFFVATPSITNLGYEVIEWLHENPKTQNMTNAEWCAILGIALFNLGHDTRSGQRYSLKDKEKQE